MAGNDKVDLSEQMLVDCAQGDCDGGWADDGLDTIIRKGGDCTEADYPYHATNGYTCKSFTPAVSISGYNFINVHYEGTDTLADSVYNNGPHAVLYMSTTTGVIITTESLKIPTAPTLHIT